ncbi:MAG TPA: hypothetical protein VFL59_07095 [Candidatus Nanopelagicales bacterium]|nr:hypothetical protein [Candidatus Nanopelagicales bacterium]
MSPTRDPRETASCPWLHRYDGLPLAEIVRLARLEQRPLRVVGVHARVASDWLASRLTVVVDDTGDVVELRTG